MNSGPLTLRTERILLRPVTIDDADFVFELVNDVDFIQYIGDKQVRTFADAKAYLKTGPIACYRQHGFGMLGMQSMESGRLMGLCGLLQRQELACPDLGYALLAQYRRQGFIFEAAQAVLLDARKRLGLDCILGLVSAQNHSSIKVLEKLGFTFSHQQNLSVGQSLVYRLFTQQ